MTQRKTASASSVVARFPAATKLFVLDTNVLMHDPTSLFRFEEHDLYIPMATLEELDNNKKGMSEVARNARQASRYLDEMITPLGQAASPRASRSRSTATRPPPGACSCRPRRSTANSRRASRAARPTTRSSRWSSTCRSCTPSAR